MKIQLFTAFFCLSAAPVFAQTGVPVVLVVDDFDSHREIANATVFVRQVASTKVTGANGKVSFDNVPVGEIEYNIMKEGYQFETGRVNVSTDVRTNVFRVSLTKTPGPGDNKILVTGEVTDADGREVEEAMVEIKIADVTRTVMTDASGNYTVDIVPNPKYPANSLRIEVKKGACKKTETVDLNRTNVIYKDLTLDCGANAGSGSPQTTGSAPPSGQPLAEKVSEGIKFTIERVEQRGSTVTISLKLENITATTAVRELWFHPHKNWIIDQDGNVFQSNRTGIGNIESTGNYVIMKLIYNTPVKAFIEFEIGAITLTKVALLKASCTYGELDFVNFPVRR